MKIALIIALTVSVPLFDMFKLAAIAKPIIDNGGCYLVNSTGKVINLTTLCGEEVKQLPKGVFQAKIKRRENGTPVIDVNFGNRKFEMILDTGASATIITTNMAQTLGIIPVGKALVNTVSANNVEMPLGYVKTMGVDGIVSSNVLVGIIPVLKIGLLGNNFFSDYDITVKRDVIEFRPQAK
jgi:predicted aspartyl protease